VRPFALAAALAVLVAAPRAEARADREVRYPLPDVFSTAVRFVRVDRGCAVTDKDADSAFLTFECPDEGTRRKHGSLELIPMKDTVRVQVTLGDDPHYVELRFLELLERKLRDERGSPVPKPEPPAEAPKPPPDGGAG
jgi:hypothetical protein